MVTGSMYTTRSTPWRELDPKLANDFKKCGTEVIIDVSEQNWGKWRHSATKYFQGDLLRAHLRRLCGREAD